MDYIFLQQKEWIHGQKLMFFSHVAIFIIKSGVNI